MKNKNTVFIILSVIIVIVAFVVVKEIIPIINENESKTRRFNDMQDKSNDVIRGIVGIIHENDIGGLTSHNGVALSENMKIAGINIAVNYCEIKIIRRGALKCSSTSK